MCVCLCVFAVHSFYIYSIISLSCWRITSCLVSCLRACVYKFVCVCVSFWFKFVCVWIVCVWIMAFTWCCRICISRSVTNTHIYKHSFGAWVCDLFIDDTRWTSTCARLPNELHRFMCLYMATSCVYVCVYYMYFSAAICTEIVEWISSIKRLEMKTTSKKNYCRLYCVLMTFYLYHVIQNLVLIFECCGYGDLTIAYQAYTHE